MAQRLYKRLKAATIKQLIKQPGNYPDGDGVYLQVAKRLVDPGPPPTYEAGASTWVWRYYSAALKKERELGLGSLRRVTLAEARKRAEEARQLRDSGTDPIDARHGERQDRQLKAAKAMSFKQCAEAYVAAKAPGWRSAVHARQWPASLETYVYPVFGDQPVAKIDTALVMKALQPIWTEKTETASRVRGRIEVVLGWAATSEYRPAGENPARWKGHLENLLAKPSAAKKAARQSNGGVSSNGRGEHLAALPYAEIGTFMVKLREQEGVAAHALEFLILTSARTGEVLGAKWGEIDLDAKLWTIPPERMKAGKEHRVPLSDAALAIIKAMAAIHAIGPLDPVFGPLASQQMVMVRLLRRMGFAVTAHGFRSSFRDWAAERSNFPSEVAEMALAHSVGSAVENAYRRSDMFEKRRELAEAWAKFCDTLPAATKERGKVVAIRAAR